EGPPGPLRLVGRALDHQNDLTLQLASADKPDQLAQMAAENLLVELRQLPRQDRAPADAQRVRELSQRRRHPSWRLEKDDRARFLRQRLDPLPPGPPRTRKTPSESDADGGAPRDDERGEGGRRTGDVLAGHADPDAGGHKPRPG